MPDASYFARKAERCRALLTVARVPEVVEQLRLWAAEFEGEARKKNRREHHKRSGAALLGSRSRA